MNIISTKSHSLLNNTDSLSNSELARMKNSDLKNTLGEYTSWISIGKLGKTCNSIIAKKRFFGKDKHQYFLQFLPDKKDIKKTLVLYIHGGGWNHFEPNNFKYVGSFFTNLGYPTISLGYRLTPKNKYPAQIEDLFMGYSKAIQNIITKTFKLTMS
jgi:acetyl esterase/lipase